MNVQQVMGVVIILMVAPVIIAVGAIVVFETTGSIDVSSESTATENVAQLINNAFTTNASTEWDNTSAGDNTLLQWDNWGTTDNAVWDNLGPQSVAGARVASWTQWTQSTTVPLGFSGVRSATITASYLLGENTETENISLYIWLGRPGGLDNVTILELENTASLFINADNTTFTTVENDISAYVTDNGVYTLYLQDNIDRVALADAGSDNYVGIVWTNANITITTYQAGYLENAIADVEDQGEVGFSLGSLIAIIVAAVALITILIAGFVGMQLKSKY